MSSGALKAEEKIEGFYLESTLDESVTASHRRNLEGRIERAEEYALAEAQKDKKRLAPQVNQPLR